LGLNTNHAFIFDLSSTDTHLQQHTVFAHVTKYGDLIVYDGQSGARLKIDQLPALNGKFHRFID
jgi:hypothetical protein